MTHALDLAVRHFTGHFTKAAKEHGVKVQILLKVPKADLTTVRLTGAPAGLEALLRRHRPDWSERFVQMHLAALKPTAQVAVAPHWKNRGLTAAPT